MDETLTDRDQEERLRLFLRDNWRWMLAGIVLGVGLLIGWNQWQGYKTSDSEAAAADYVELQKVLAKGDHEQATRMLQTLAEEHGRSPYPDHARLLLAKTHIEKGRYADAVALLRTVAEQSKDKELAELASLRLARVLLQEGKPDEALNALKLPKDSAYEALAHDIRGDIHYARGKTTEARAEYAAALEGDEAVIDRTLVELKLQQVGGKPAAALKVAP
ncbi:MAG TPA: tetratricopeptide repeat protein [Steroidobacteraceae bacterium]|nr:tetratricopeptide repeat protein [Steroidobacteraceae bacterium]